MIQEKYATKILDRFDMSDYKPKTTPCEQKLDFITCNNNGLADPRKYCQVIGDLIYLMTYTWPDLNYIVGKLLQYLLELYEPRLIIVKHVLRYLKGTTGYQLC